MAKGDWGLVERAESGRRSGPPEPERDQPDAHRNHRRPCPSDACPRTRARRPLHNHHLLGPPVPAHAVHPLSRWTVHGREGERAVGCCAGRGVRREEGTRAV